MWGAEAPFSTASSMLSGLAEFTLEAAKAHSEAYDSPGAQDLIVFPSLGYTTDPRERVDCAFCGVDDLIVESIVLGATAVGSTELPTCGRKNVLTSSTYAQCNSLRGHGGASE